MRKKIIIIAILLIGTILPLAGCERNTYEIEYYPRTGAYFVKHKGEWLDYNSTLGMWRTIEWVELATKFDQIEHAELAIRVHREQAYGAGVKKVKKVIY